MLRNGPLWAITCLYNPAGFQARLETYQVFREHLQLPLLAVELSWDSPFALKEGDADKLVQIRGGAKLWQKERLLNLAVQNLPAECKFVAWLDADILFQNPNWAEVAVEQLEKVPVTQAFSMVRYLGPDGRPERTRPSTAEVLKNTTRAANWLETSLDRAEGSPSPGHAWVGRRDFLERFGFYDGCIIGGGDTAFLCALTGEFDTVIRMHKMGDAQSRRYKDWARPVHEYVQKGMNFVPGVIDHLWHGSIEDRHGRERHIGLRGFDFDPYTDIEIGENGALNWKSNRPYIQRFVEDYFKLRNEDSALVSSEIK